MSVTPVVETCRGERRAHGMDFSGAVGEDEIIKMNLALAERRDFTAADVDALGDDVRAEAGLFRI